MPRQNIPQVAGQPHARGQLFAGVTRLADLLAPTLGPLGTPVFSTGNVANTVELLDDAATVARRIISLGDPKLDVGAMLMRNAVWRVTQRTGDGGAATAVLLHAILAQGLRQVTAGSNAMRLLEGLRRAAVVAEQALAAQARPLADESQLAAAARTVTRDDDLSVVVAEMSYLLGPDATVQIETFVAPWLQREYITGAVYKARIASSYLYTEVERKRAAHAGPAIVLADHNIDSAEQGVALLQAAVAAGRTSLLVVAPAITGPALNLFVANHLQPADKRKLAVLGISLMAVGEERETALFDLGVLCGATVLGSHSGRKADKVRPEDLGVAHRVEFSAERLAVVPVPERRALVQDEIALLRTRLDRTPLDDDARPALERRLAALTGGMGVLKVGTNSKLATDLRKSQAERALKVLSSIQRTGVVAGGGAALVHCIPAVRQAAAAEPDDDIRNGMYVLAAALDAPMRRLLHNAGLRPPSVALNHVAEAGAPATYDVERGAVADAYAAGVVDAAGVVEAILQTAVSGASMALSTDAIVYHRNPQQAMQP